MISLLNIVLICLYITVYILILVKQNYYYCDLYNQIFLYIERFCIYKKVLIHDSKLYILF
jgi:hypothetical protein